MFDLEKIIADGRWYANADSVPNICKKHLNIMADTIEEQQKEIRRLEMMLAPYLAAEYKK